MRYTFPISVLVVTMVGTASYGISRSNVASNLASLAVGDNVPTIEMMKLDGTKAIQIKESSKNKGEDDDPIVPVPSPKK